MFEIVILSKPLVVDPRNLVSMRVIFHDISLLRTVCRSRRGRRVTQHEIVHHPVGSQPRSLTTVARHPLPPTPATLGA